MTKEKQLKIIIIVLIIVLGGGLLNCAFAGGNHNPNITINNYYEQPEPQGEVNNLDTGTTNNISVTNGVSDRDLAKGMSMAAALGGHHFDFSTTDHQVAINYAFDTDYEDDGSASVAYARNWKKVSWMPNALVHVEYATNSSTDMIMFGGTFRIK